MTALSLEQLRKIAPAIDPPVIDDFHRRMDPDYFSQFPETTIATHLAMLQHLTSTTPCAIHVQKTKSHSYSVAVVAFDFFSEFSTICGLLSAFGLDIREALIFTYIDPQEPDKPRSTFHPTLRRTLANLKPTSSRHPGLYRKKVVDVFQVQVLPGFKFGKTEQHRLYQELTHLLRLLDAKHMREVRSQVNRLLIEALGKRTQPFTELIHPVEIRFNNDLDTQETCIDIQATDSPAFLYTFSNALTMRGLYISKAKIEVDGTRVRNRFFVKGRQGNKLQDQRDQAELRVAAALIKEFTHYLTWAPDPGKALNHFDLLLDQLLEDNPTKPQISWLNKKENLTVLAQMLGASDFLWEDFLRRQHANLLPILKNFHPNGYHPSIQALTRKLHRQLRKAKGKAERKTLLNLFKDEELFRIDMDHLLQGSSLQEFSSALTRLAIVILQQALLEARSVIEERASTVAATKYRSLPISICGLGKLGGGELGYASDIEVLFIYGHAPFFTLDDIPDMTEYVEHVAQEFLGWIDSKKEGIFHIDTRLRPHGEKGLLANSLDEIRNYYSPNGQAAPFERQALIKLRHIAGNTRLGKQVELLRDRFVYGQEPWPLDTALHLRKRQTQELVPAGNIHVKYSPGGLIDIEYTVQYLQIIHGYARSSLHTPNTKEAIHALRQHHFLTEKEASTLEEDYVFMRRLIDALRIVRGNAQDLLLPASGSEGMIFLARRMGFMTENWLVGADQLEQDITRRMARTHLIFKKKFKTESSSQTGIPPKKRRLSKKEKS